jgi:hypothetical protein
MTRGEDDHSGTDAGTASNADPAGRLQIAVLSNPRPILDGEFPSSITLEDRAVANIHAVAKMYVTCIEDQHSLLDDDALAERPEVLQPESTAAVGSGGHT